MDLNIPNTILHPVWVAIAIGALAVFRRIVIDWFDFRQNRRLQGYVTELQCERGRQALLGEFTANCSLCASGVNTRLNQGEGVFLDIRKEQLWMKASMICVIRKLEISDDEIEREMRLHSTNGRM